MSQFHYRALDGQNTPKNGKIDADSKVHAVKVLQDKGWLVLSVKSSRVFFWQPQPQVVLNRPALSNLTRQLATLIAANQPLERALTSLIRQQRVGKVRVLLERVLANVKDGKSFSQALEMENNQFSALYLSMVRAGEASGSLNVTLQQLSDYLEQSHKIRAELINALIYPVFLLVGVLGSIFVLLTYVIPQFVPIFVDMNIEIPLITRIILSVGEWCNQYGIFLLLVAAVLTILSKILLQQSSWREKFDTHLLNAPLIGTLIRQSEAARVSRTLGTLLKNGVALLQALKIVERVGRNQAIAAQLCRAREQIKAGQMFSTVMASPRLMPDLAIEMMMVGEVSGELDNMLMQVANIFDNETRRGIERLMAVFTPMLTLVMAVLVMGIMLAVMLPLMSLTNNI